MNISYRAVCTKLQHCCAALLLITSTNGVFANSQQAPLSSSINADEIQQLYQESGMAEQLKLMPSSSTGALDGLFEQNEVPEVFAHVKPKALKQAIGDAFTVKDLEKSLLGQYTTSMSSDDIHTVLTWYASELGKRFKLAELQFAKETLNWTDEDFGEAFKYQAADVKRREIIEKLDRTLLGTDSAVRMMNNVQIAFSVGITPLLPDNQKTPLSVMLEYATQQYDDMVYVFTDYVQSSMLYMYRDFTEAELSAMLDVFSTPEGQAYIQATSQGVNKGMFNASLRLGKAVSKLAKEQSRDIGI